VPYLERVINFILIRLSRLLRILHFHAHDLNLKPSATAYKRYGQDPKQWLRFSKRRGRAPIRYGSCRCRSCRPR
jgi:hypothetical protein